MSLCSASPLLWLLVWLVRSSTSTQGECGDFPWAFKLGPYKQSKDADLEWDTIGCSYFQDHLEKLDVDGEGPDPPALRPRQTLEFKPACLLAGDCATNARAITAGGFKLTYNGHTSTCLDYTTLNIGDWSTPVTGGDNVLKATIVQLFAAAGVDDPQDQVSYVHSSVFGQTGENGLGRSVSLTFGLTSWAITSFTGLGLTQGGCTAKSTKAKET